MGIERFFSSIQQSKITNKDNKFIVEQRLDIESIYIDFNSEIHNISSKIVSKLNDNILKAIKNNKDIPKYQEEDIDQLIIDGLKSRIINIAKVFTYHNKIKKIYLGIDGVPTMGKIIEQKRRRYLGFVLESIKKEIFKKYKNSIDDNRLKFIKSKVSFNKTKISPGTEFMYNLIKELRSESFLKELKKELPSLVSYDVSDYNEYGEGEMKIFWIAKNNSLIVSPDSDVTLLGLLLNTKYTNIKILRFNQQKQIYEIIDIDTLKKNIMSYCKSKKEETIVDLVTLFTLFGNDFVPKVLSINVKSGFKNLIDIYLKVTKKVKKSFILEKDKKINSRFFLELLKEISSQEKTALQESYAEKNYKNYNYLKSVLGEDNFIIKIEEFLSDLKQFNENQKLKNFKTKDFIKKLRKLVRSGEVYKNDMHFIKNYFHHKKIKGYYPNVNIIFRRYSDTIQKEFPNKYEEEIYKLENMKGDYKKLLGIKNLELGKVFVDIKNYKFEDEDMNDSIKKYYNKYDKKTVIKQFLTAFIFTFRHYVVSNKFLPIIWHYPFNISPLISDVYEFVKKDPDYINRITLRISDNYFDAIQHLVYTSPVEDLKPKEFRKNMTNEYLNRLKESIDCTGQIFISKCFIETEDEDPDEFIKKTDNIKKLENTWKLLGRYDREDDLELYNAINMDNFNRRL